MTQDLLQALSQHRKEQCVPGELRELASAIVDVTLALLFPHFASPGRTVEQDLAVLRAKLHQVARHLDCECDPTKFVEMLPEIRDRLEDDATAIFEGDPAAKSVDEVILAYPGFLATAVYRLSHAIVGMDVPLLPRLLSESAHSRTGIDIHPGAQIGRRFFIDHGTGLVIGETAVIGDDVKLYQGVTLGALTVDKAHAQKKRHPTLGNRVVVYANATILGGKTVVGDGAIIGGNVWLTRSVPAGAVVTHQPDIRVRAPGEEVPLDFNI